MIDIAGRKVRTASLNQMCEMDLLVLITVMYFEIYMFVFTLNVTILAL